MCGIAGVVQFDGAPVPERLVESMCAAIRHRGPDEHGTIALPSDHAAGRARATLGSQRLSIIDVAGGHQPIANEDGSVWTVYNGEIYNFADVRACLEREGHRFRTRSDTEVIVHAYEQWGDAFVQRIDGMFALALWDDRAERLVLARDRFGKKPLFYHDDGARVVFASELQALRDVPGISRDIDMSALGEYLAYMAIPAPCTIYRDVRKVPPAHAFVRDAGGGRVQRYWSLGYQPKRTATEDEALARVNELLTAAVRKRLVSEVPLGAFLSGGVDSSGVVAIMAALSDRPVKTFSIGFDDADYDELPHARRVAEAFGCEHHEFVVRPSAVEVLPDMVRHFGEPFADSSAVPSWYLAKLTRANVTVALNGDGGDEIFAGYGRHLSNALAEGWRQVPSPVRRSLERVARSRLLADAGGARIARFWRAAEMSRAERYRRWAGVFSADAARALTSAALPDADAVPCAFECAAPLDAVDAMLAVDTRYYLPTDLLVKVDVTSMAHSLEVRSPLLDTELAEYVASLPTGFKLRRFTTKYLLKKALAGRVPASNLHRAKRGFAVPIARWFRGELRQFVNDHLRPSTAAAAGLLDQPAVDRLIADHESGTHDRAHQLWTLLMLELWHREFA